MLEEGSVCCKKNSHLFSCLFLSECVVEIVKKWKKVKKSKKMIGFIIIRFSVDGLEDLYNFTAHHLLSSTFYNAFALELKLN